MRISTVTVFDQSISSLHRQQNAFVKVGQQVASGLRVNRPSDDPQAASSAVGVSQSMAATQQFADARISARNSLHQETGILGSISDAISRAKTLVIQGASDTLSDADRTSVASELKGVLETIIGQANATDGNGRYLFGGYEDGSEPFVRNADGKIEYEGDGNSLKQRIDASRSMEVADNGEAVFQRVHGGAGYVAKADADNTGNVTFTGPRVLDFADPEYGTKFTVEFNKVGDDFEYSVDGGGTWEPYRPGEPIAFGGLSLTLEGTPADGDSITVGLAQDMEPDLFETVASAIAVLDEPAETDAEKAALRNTMNTVMRELDNSLDNILTVNASVGARLNELDTVDLVADKRTANYKQTLSDLVDLDYVEASSEYMRRQIGLQAAQKSFVDVSKLTLFNYM